MASTNADIREVWGENVFGHADVQAITESIYDYKLDPTSQSELAKMYFNKEINYIEYVVSSSQIPRLCGGKQFNYSVDITVTRKADSQGLNFNKVLDTLETILSLQVSELESDWQEKIDYYENPDNAPTVDYLTVADVPCYRANLQILGFKFE